MKHDRIVMSRTRSSFKGLSLDRLETLSRIVAGGSIARAAVGDSNKQSQFSRQIAELEAWFGVVLLDRASSPNKPTVAARRIVREVDDFLREMESVREEAEGGRKTMVLGAGERMIRSYLIPWASRNGDAGLRFVFKNLTSSAIRAELLAKRVDLGILRKDRCPAGMEHFALKPIPMVLLLPEAVATNPSKWSWERLESTPLVLLEGEGRFRRFLREKERESGIRLDVAMECSTWTQVLDAMKECGLGGFVPKDLERQFPAGLVTVKLAGLEAYSDDYVMAWSAAEAEKRSELGRLLKRLGR